MSEKAEKIDFLGKGWSFPVRFKKVFNSIELSTGNIDIKESLRILLSTVPGERFMHPKFGCDLKIMSFESLDISMKTQIEESILNSIILFEPRITVEDIDFEEAPKEGIVYIHIIYVINTTNVRTNIVFPYYLREGTDL